MKFQTYLVCVLIGAAVVWTQGCGEKKSDFRPLSGGFGVVTTWIGIDSGPSAELYFKDEKSNLTLIWPFLGTRSYDPLFTNDMAFFIADMPDELGRLGTGVYLAVQAPGPALDVSQDLLKLWAESQKLDFNNFREHYEPLRVNAVTNGILVEYLTGRKHPEAKFVVTWEQVSNIIQDVKLTGKKHVTDKYKVVYLKKDYSSINGDK